MIEPLTIAPDGLYDDTSLYEAIGLTPTALANARRAGTLRYTRQGKRTLYLGKWILGATQIFSAILERPESATLDVLDLGVSF